MCGYLADVPKYEFASKKKQFKMLVVLSPFTSGGHKNNFPLQLISSFKCVKNFLSTNLYQEIYAKCFQPVVIYGLAKIQELLVNNFPKFRPILSAIESI